MTARPDLARRVGAKQELTTHIVVSFPPGTDRQAAYLAGRAWAWDVFGSGRNGGDTYDYVTAFHTDRPHPHLHVVVNRRSFEGNWLKISHRNVHINYDSMREALVVAGARHGIHLEATSREQRGIEGRSLTTEQYRQLVRQGVIIRDNQEDQERKFTHERSPGDASGPSDQSSGADGQASVKRNGSQK